MRTRVYVTLLHFLKRVEYAPTMFGHLFMLHSAINAKRINVSYKLQPGIPTYFSLKSVICIYHYYFINEDNISKREIRMDRTILFKAFILIFNYGLYKTAN